MSNSNTNTNDAIADPDSADADVQTNGLILNLLIGIPVTIVCLLAFDPLRRRIPSIFETRRKMHNEKDPTDFLGNRVSTPPAPSHKFLGWLRPTLSLDLETIADTHGLDAALLLRFNLLMMNMFLVLFIPALALLAIYFTSSNKNLPKSDSEVTIGVNRFSISNISKSDGWRLWIVLLCEYFVVIFVCTQIYRHFTQFCRDRRRYRSSRLPSNYAVLVQDIPPESQSAEAVSRYWDRAFPGHVAHVIYVNDARKLEGWKKRFWMAVDKREMAEYRLTYVADREQKLEEKLQRKGERRANATGGVLRKRGRKKQEKSWSETPVSDDEFGGTGNDSARSESRWRRRRATRGSQRLPGSDALPPAPPPVVQEAADDALSPQRLRAEAQEPPVHETLLDELDAHDEDADGGMDGRPRRRKWPKLPMGPPSDPALAVAYWDNIQRHAWAKVVAHQRQRDEGQFPVTNAAIVVFKSRWSASVAAQTNFSRMENEWRVSRAPEPSAINWGALCVTGWTIYARQLITNVLATALTLLWIFPVTLIMSIVNLDSLVNLKINDRRPFQFLEKIQGLSPLLTSFVQSWIPTVILSLFLGLVPNILGFFVSISRIVSQAERDLRVRNWYFIFVTFSNFLFVAFAGTLLDSLSKIVQKPALSVEILANNIPRQAAFVMNLVLYDALWMPRELLQSSRVIGRWFKLKFSARTERQKEEADVGDTEMDYVGSYSSAQLVTLLGLVFITIQPFIVVCCIAYFAMNFMVLKYNLCYSFYNEYGDGGQMYAGALYSIWVGLFSHLLTMVGVFGLSKSPAQSVLIILPTVGTAMFFLYCRVSFDRVIEHGSVLETQDRMEEYEGIREDYVEDELVKTYEHPGFEELPDYAEVGNTGGENDEEDAEARAVEKLMQLEEGGFIGGDTMDSEEWSRLENLARETAEDDSKQAGGSGGGDDEDDDEDDMGGRGMGGDGNVGREDRPRATENDEDDGSETAALDLLSADSFHTPQASDAFDALDANEAAHDGRDGRGANRHGG